MTIVKTAGHHALLGLVAACELERTWIRTNQLPPGVRAGRQLGDMPPASVLAALGRAR